MLDFSRVRQKEITFNKLIENLTIADLRDLTNEMIDLMLGKIVDCTDDDVVFMPIDPNAHDPYAATTEEANISWTLGHVIVHTTASAEENAAQAATMARGVPLNGRCRYEIPWQSITTIDQCRQRLTESRRMRLASLDMWPDEPHLEYVTQSEINALGQFVLGLRHDSSHLNQIDEIVRQATAVHRPL